MGRRSGLAFCLLALGACTRTAEAPPEPERRSDDRASVPAPAPAAVSDEDISGSWRILSLNGAPPQGGISADPRRAPYLVFRPGGYGGNTGCNDFGGYSVLQGDRLYASGAMQTLIGCDRLRAQEAAIIGLLTSSPLVSIAKDGTLNLTGGSGRMVLKRDREASRPHPQELDREPELLAGTRWTIGGIDGAWLSGAGGRSLSFEAEQWTLAGPCGTRSGGWQQSADRIEPVGAGTATPTPCAAAEKALDSSLAALMTSSSRFATGPNGEILIGGGGHWLSGERPRDALADDNARLAGPWRIVAVDGRPPVARTDVGLAFGPGGYSGGSGCNSLQGLHLAQRRRLYTGHHLQTQQGCAGPIGAQEKRIADILAASPRIAGAGEGEVALVVRDGGLRLRREARADADSPVTHPWRGEPLDAELTMLDGEPLRMRLSEPAIRLRLTAQRFDLYSGCARLGGIWRRRGQALEFLTDPEPPPAGACGGALVARLQTFMSVFNGPFRAVIGRGSELLIAGEGHWLAGNVTRSPPRPLSRTKRNAATPK